MQTEQEWKERAVENVMEMARALHARVLDPANLHWLYEDWNAEDIVTVLKNRADDLVKHLNAKSQ